jgi:tetraacyldisaccharide 4'-kinase
MVFLRPVAWLFGIIVALRNRAYDVKIFATVKTAVPVISVGNITAGGSGKTPLTEYILRYYTGRGIKTGILSRGYKRSTSGTRIVADGGHLRGTAADCGDEPFQMAKKFPSAVVVVDEDRIRGAQMMIERFHPGCIVLDDGFQHRRIARDLDIVLMDGNSLEGPPALLPAGRFREPLRSLGRAGCIVLLAPADDVSSMQEIVRKYFHGPVVVARKRPSAVVRIIGGDRAVPASIAGKSAVAFCGIATPESFRSTLGVLNCQVNKFRSFGDHYRYTADELRELKALVDSSGAEIIVTTEKDAARIAGTELENILDDRWYYIEIEMALTQGETAFYQLLDRIMQKAA